MDTEFDEIYSKKISHSNIIYTYGIAGKRCLASGNTVGIVGRISRGADKKAISGITPVFIMT